MQMTPSIRQTRLAIALSAMTTLCLFADATQANDAEIARGKYLVTLAGCGDCHTPGHFFGKPDPTRVLGGSDVGFQIPGVGTIVGSNLTPDEATGIGSWTREQIARAIRSGVRPDGRVLAPVMPWAAFSKLSADDTNAIVSYLKQLPPVKHRVPGPLPADQPPSTFSWKLTPPGNPGGGKTSTIR